MSDLRVMRPRAERLACRPARRSNRYSLAQPPIDVVGGAGDLPDDQGLGSLFAEIVALSERLRSSIVDGGTDAGIMRLVGKARVAAQATFPLVGVAAEGTVVIPGGLPAGEDAYPLEPNHSHFVLVPGSDWGDEVPWLGRVAEALAGSAPTATVLVNGGDVARRDVEASVESGRLSELRSGRERSAEGGLGLGRERELS